jgi:hypothetical protein
LSNFEGGREIVVMLIGRELNREYERKIQSDEISPISQALTSELLDNKGLVAAAEAQETGRNRGIVTVLGGFCRLP